MKYMRYEYENDKKFNSVEVTLAMGCKLNCRFCPQKKLLNRYFSDNKKRDSIMSMEVFKRILTQVKRGGTICFSGMCEVFHNPNCAKMIKYAFENGYRISLLTTLIGASIEDLEYLKDVEFDEITLHIPDDKGNSKFIITDKYLEIVSKFQQMFSVTNYSCHGNIHPDVKNIIDTNLFVGKTMNNRAGNLSEGEEVYSNGEIVCMVGTNAGLGNWAPEILPDGTVILCCMDYGMQYVLGNIVEMTADEILRGKAYQDVLKGMKCEESNILCRQCIAARNKSMIPAYQLKKMLSDYKNNRCLNLNNEQKSILSKLSNAKYICIFGLGKLFWDNFYNQRWNEAFDNIIFSDNAENMWGKEIRGKICISPKELINYDNLLIITHIKDDSKLRIELDELKLNNIISINDIYSMFK